METAVAKKHEVIAEANVLNLPVYRVFDRAPVMMQVIDEHGVLVDVNRRWTQTMGYKKEEVLGRRSTEFLTAESVARAVKDTLPLFWRTGSTRSISYRFVRKDGRTLPIELDADVVALTGGRRYSVAALRDVGNSRQWKTARATLKAVKEGMGFSAETAISDAEGTGPRKETAPQDSPTTYAAFLEAILRTSEDAVISVDEGQRIVEFNDGAERLFGYRRSELLGSDIDRLIPARFRPAHRRHIMDFVNSPATSRLMGQRSDIVGRRKDGTGFPAEASVSKADVQGRVLFTVILRDVTQRAEAEDALRASEERFRGLVENASDAIVVVQDGATVFRNPVYERLLGYTSTELRELNPQIIAPEDRERVRYYAERRLRGEDVPDEYEIGLVTPGGRKVTMEARSRSIDYDGRPAVLVMLRDITERKQAEEALRASEEKFRLLAEHAHDMIYRYRVADPRGFEYVSPGSVRITGYTPDEWHEGVAPVAFRAQLVESGPAWSTQESLTLQTFHKNGSAIWIELTRTPIYDDSGTLIAIEGIARDVTERMAAQENLRIVNEELASSRRRIVETQEKLRRDMAEQLHGRVQNRLLVATTRIRQAIDELGDDDALSVGHLITAANILDEVAQRDLREIVNELHPMIGRVGLLAFLRTMIDGYSPSFRVDLVMPDRAWAIRTLAEPRLDKGLSLAIYRVVEEALNNVQKHARAVSARVTIEPTEHNEILVTVQDDGEGFVVDAAPPGFGLHSMSDYCGVQGGSIRIESRPGSGTSVVATFPLGASA